MFVARKTKSQLYLQCQKAPYILPRGLSIPFKPKPTSNSGFSWHAILHRRIPHPISADKHGNILLPLDIYDPFPSQHARPRRIDVLLPPGMLPVRKPLGNPHPTVRRHTQVLIWPPL
jgi:hypothetical protein